MRFWKSITVKINWAFTPLLKYIAFKAQPAPMGAKRGPRPASVGIFSRKKMLYREALVRIREVYVGKVLGILRAIDVLTNRRLVFWPVLAG